MGEFKERSSQTLKARFNRAAHATDDGNELMVGRIALSALMFWRFHESWGRCPRLPVAAAPLALIAYHPPSPER